MARKKNYLNNADLLAETVLSQKQGRMTDKLAKMLMTLCDRYRASKNADFTNYTYFDDMKSFALLNLTKNAWRKFNPEVYSNAFAYYTQCVYHSYLQYLNQEKRHRNIRDALLVISGQNPSFSFQERYAEELANAGEVSSDDVIDKKIEHSDLYS